LWSSRQNSDEERSVACLPDRLKAELAIHVHLDTLKRVDIFQNTEAGFLCELVLRLKPVLFSPGDFVCRKDEVGHEMYIVSRGILEVVAEEARARVVATLRAGSYFGEISVLNVGSAGNKRTASVRSVGYSDLFCLNKQDLWDVLKNYPNAEARIRTRAEERLSKLGQPTTAAAAQHSGRPHTSSQRDAAHSSRRAPPTREPGPPPRPAGQSKRPDRKPRSCWGNFRPAAESADVQSVGSHLGCASNSCWLRARTPVPDCGCGHAHLGGRWAAADWRAPDWTGAAPKDWRWQVHGRQHENQPRHQQQQVASQRAWRRPGQAGHWAHSCRLGPPAWPGAHLPPEDCRPRAGRPTASDSDSEPYGSAGAVQRQPCGQLECQRAPQQAHSCLSSRLRASPLPVAVAAPPKGRPEGEQQWPPACAKSVSSGQTLDEGRRELGARREGRPSPARSSSHSQTGRRASPARSQPAAPEAECGPEVAPECRIDVGQLEAAGWRLEESALEAPRGEGEPRGSGELGEGRAPE